MKNLLLGLALALGVTAGSSALANHFPPAFHGCPPRPHCHNYTVPVRRLVWAPTPYGWRWVWTTQMEWRRFCH